MSVRNAKDFWSGILFTVLGVFLAFSVSDLRYGTAARMGPAFFPTALCALMAVIGAGIALHGLFGRRTPEGRLQPVNWRALLLVHGAVIAFSLLLTTCGLLAALAALILLSSMADRGWRWKETVACIFALSALACLIFVKLVGMHMALLPPALGLGI